jgi:hypothetical protein
MSTANDNHQTMDLKPRGGVVDFFVGPRLARYRLVVWAYVLASASHLWLADAWQLAWVPADLVYVIGLIILVVSGGAAGWLGCLIGLLIPLFFLRDQLTQSGLLAAMALAGTVLVWLDARRNRAGDERPEIVGLLRTLRGLTIATYCLAVLHKLNRDFFAVETGCTTYGVDEVLHYWHLDPGVFSALAPAHPWVTIGFEAAIPLAYLLGRRHLARTLAVAFHIPLTLTMAPAFAFVMAAGHAAFVTDAERRALWLSLQRRGRWLIPVALLITAASLAAHDAWPEPTMIPREFLLWGALLWFVASWRDVRAAVAREETGAGPVAHGVARWVPRVIVSAFVLNGFTPYLGVQYQHTAAMLSNLRVDQGCWNHWFIPEAVRITDDYVRVDEAWFGEPGALEEYEQIVLEQLWSPPQIRQMRRNWCRREIRPFHMHGTYRGREWTIDDLCDESEPWPFEDAGIFGVELFGDYLRFQKNLMRECPQTCIH